MLRRMGCLLLWSMEGPNFRETRERKLPAVLELIERVELFGEALGDHAILNPRVTWIRKHPIVAFVEIVQSLHGRGAGVRGDVRGVSARGGMGVGRRVLGVGG